MKRLIVIVVIACLGLSRAFSQDAHDGDTESKLIALERLVRLQAFASRDLSILHTFVADDFVRVTGEGQSQNKAELLADLQTWGVRASAEQMIARTHGSTAIVTGLFQMSGVQRGKPFVRKDRFLDTWVNRDGHWLMIASVSTPLR